MFPKATCLCLFIVLFKEVLVDMAWLQGPGEKLEPRRENLLSRINKGGETVPLPSSGAEIPNHNKRLKGASEGFFHFA